MEGVMITDDACRRILSTYFVNPALATLALESVTHSKMAITWIPNLDGDYRAQQREEEEDSDEEEGRSPWSASRRPMGGSAVIQIIRNGIRFVAPVSKNVDPIIPLAFLNQLHQVIESYVGGAVTEASLKDNFDIVLELLEEMLSAGRPLVSEGAQLRELVVPLSQLTKVAATVGIPVNIASSNANSLLASPIPWRRSGLKYTSNEIYFDVTESLSFILDKAGKAISGNVTGRIECCTKLSGMPDLVLTFTDPAGIEDCAFNSCVRYSKWTKEAVVSFIPPDGNFTLMSYGLPSPTKSLSAVALVPITLRPSFTHGALGGTFHLTLTSRTSPNQPLSNLVVRFSIGKSSNGITASANGGNLDTGGGGRWEFEAETGEVVWRIEKLSSIDRPAILSGQFLSVNGSRPTPAVAVTFESTASGFSGLRIAALKLTGENYSIFKGVRLRGQGEIEVRCLS